MIATEKHLKAARALVGLSQDDLANLAGVSIITIKRFEAFGGTIGCRPETKRKLEAALRKAGVLITKRGVYLADD